MFKIYELKLRISFFFFYLNNRMAQMKPCAYGVQYSYILHINIIRKRFESKLRYKEKNN